MEEKLFELMAQAEYLQSHAAKLQNEAQETFSALPLAVEQAGRRIRSEGLQMALILLAFGCIVAGAVFGFLLWSTNSLRDERAALQTELSGLKASIQAEKNTLAEMKSKTWGLSLHEDDKGRFIVLLKGTGLETNWTVDKTPAAKIIKK